MKTAQELIDESDEVVKPVKKVKKCQMEGCNGVASGNLIIIDKETGKDLDVCSECYCRLTDSYCQSNNCGNPAVDTNDAGELVCKECKK